MFLLVLNRTSGHLWGLCNGRKSECRMGAGWPGKLELGLQFSALPWRSATSSSLPDQARTFCHLTCSGVVWVGHQCPSRRTMLFTTALPTYHKLEDRIGLSICNFNPDVSIAFLQMHTVFSF